jgi:hypothetical protein
LLELKLKGRKCRLKLIKIQLKLNLIHSRGKRFFSSPLHPDWLCGSLSLLHNGCREVKQLGREADHSPPSSAKVKNGGAIPPLPLHLDGVVLN